jgi:hypothetical protein
MVLLLAACYRYVPTTEPLLTPGVHARFALAEPNGALRSILGAETIGVEGKVVSTSDSAYRLSVAATVKPGIAGGLPRRTVWGGDSVAIPRTAVGIIELRSLDRGRTARVIAIGAVATVIAMRLIVTTVGSSGGGGGDGGGVIPP